jgi:hypothetical protein
MATAKTTALTFRIEPNLKDALRTAAANDHRFITNIIEVMIREHCARVGIAIAEWGNLSRVSKITTPFVQKITQMRKPQPTRTKAVRGMCKKFKASAH